MKIDSIFLEIVHENLTSFNLQCLFSTDPLKLFHKGKHKFVFIYLFKQRGSHIMVIDLDT